MKTRTIVVATDGTEHGRAALDWAAREARHRRAQLRIVHAYEWDWHETRYDVGNEYIDVARSLAEAVVADAYHHAQKITPDVPVTTEILIGRPAPRLLEVSRDADVLVVGHRGRGGFAGLLLGSVSESVAAHAPCPVVVVRGHSAEGDGPVVVGIDDSPASEAVLARAFAEADEREAAVVVVHSYLPVIPLWVADLRPESVDTPEQDAAEGTGLDERLAPWREKYPVVPVETVLNHRSAAATLVERSHGAQLVVVGTRRHGRAGAVLAGSAGLQLLHHADCPVLIVRHEEALP